MKRLIIIAGTRPEIIKIAPIIREIKRQSMKLFFIHSGQHYDFLLSQQIIKDLELPKPQLSFKLQTSSTASGVPEPARSAAAGLELVDQLEPRPHDRHEHHLGEPLADGDSERLSPPIPARNQHLSLIVRIDETHQIAQDDAMFVAEPGTGQDVPSDSADQRPSGLCGFGMLLSLFGTLLGLSATAVVRRRYFP